MNTPGGNANATAEHAFALIMSVLRKTPFANETTHKGQWEKKNIKGTELSKKTLGIVGFGNVGVRLSHLVKGFDMKILVNSKSLESRKSEYPHVENASFDDLINKLSSLFHWLIHVSKHEFYNQIFLILPLHLFVVLYFLQELPQH